MALQFHSFLEFPTHVLPGIVVPQQVYPSPNAFQPRQAVRFYMAANPNRLGIRLIDARDQNFTGLLNINGTLVVAPPDAPAPAPDLGDANRVTLRILVCPV